MESIAQIQRNIDDILGIVESNIRGTTTPEDFLKSVDFEFIVDEDYYHITKSRALKVGAQWKTHSHKEGDETIILIKGRGVVVLENEQFVLTQGESVRIPKGTEHGGYALEEGAEILSILVPSDKNSKILKGLLDSVSHGRS